MSLTETRNNFKPLKTDSDPNGKSSHEAGAKLDHGKNRVGLVIQGFAPAIKAVSEVGTFGANKYSDNGWKKVPNGVERYTDAMHRHLLEEADENSDIYDHETKLLHASAAAWNALARLTLILKSTPNRNPNV